MITAKDGIDDLVVEAAGKLQNKLSKHNPHQYIRFRYESFCLVNYNGKLVYVSLYNHLPYIRVAKNIQVPAAAVSHIYCVSNAGMDKCMAIKEIAAHHGIPLDHCILLDDCLINTTCAQEQGIKAINLKFFSSKEVSAEKLDSPEYISSSFDTLKQQFTKALDEIIQPKVGATFTPLRNIFNKTKSLNTTNLAQSMDTDIPNEDMADSAFGQGSNTAKAMRTLRCNDRMRKNTPLRV